MRREGKPSKCGALVERECRGILQLAIPVWSHENPANLNESRSVDIDFGKKQIVLLP